jgi:hypothetical protein
MEKPLHALGEGVPKHSTQIISLFVGGILFLIGLSGLMLPEFAGLHLSFFYSLIVIFSGLSLLYSGYLNNSRAAFLSCIAFSIFFGLHAIVGWVFGGPGIPTVGHEMPDSKWIRIIPNFYELGRNDHILNTILSLVLSFGAIDWWIQHMGQVKRIDFLRKIKNDNFRQIRFYKKKITP